MAKSSRNKKSRSRQSSRKSPKGNRNTSSPSASTGKKGNTHMVLSSRNYQLMILGVVLVVIGYAMMRIDNEVDGFISLYVAPLIILGGYLEIIYAILWKPKAKDERTDQPVEIAAEG